MAEITVERIDDPRNASVLMLAPAAPELCTGQRVTYIKVIGNEGEYIYLRVPEKTKKRSGLSKENLEMTANVAGKVDEYMKKHALGARNIEVNWTSLAVSYEMPRGERKTIKFSKITDDNLRNETIELSRALELHTTTDLSIDSNRPFGSPAPLRLDRWPVWHANHRLPLNQEIGQNFEAFRQRLETDMGAEGAQYSFDAIPKMAAAWHLTKTFRDALETEFNALVEPPHDQAAALIAYRRKKEALKNLIIKLNQLDTKAVYRSVPYAKPELTGLSEKEQTERALLSREEMNSHLMENLDKISEGNRLTNRFNTDMKVPGEAARTAYSQEKGDLLIHDRWRYEEHSALEGHERRGPSMEEFIVFNTLNLKSEDQTTITQAMESLAISCDKDTLVIIKTALETARKEARTAYDSNYSVNNPSNYIHQLT